MNVHKDTDYFLNHNLTKSHLMLFDLATGGHHASYILHIVRYWCTQKLPEKLDIVVSPKFIDEHADIVEIARKLNQNNIRFVSISWEEYSNLNSQHSFLTSIFYEWSIYVRYATHLKVDHALLMYFDRFQLPIFLGSKSPCSFSGIYFRPTLHYRNFDNYVSSWKDKLREFLKKILLSIVIRKSQLKFLFCLDPLAIKHIKNLNGKTKILHLPDPVEIYNVDKSKAAQLKTKLGIDSERQVFLLFGRISSRKGIYQLLEAILCVSPDIAKKICLLIVGSSSHADKLLVQKGIKTITQSVNVQIITNSDYIPEQDVQLYFYIADVILAPYQQHVGMSGIILLAAAAQKPVIGSDYGLMGQLIRDYQLGITIDSKSPNLIAKALEKIIINRNENHYNMDSMHQFACKHSHELFSQTLYTNLNLDIKS